jgi:hypothetical protein
VLLGAWVLMILVGVAHHDWWSLLPTMSYKVALLISAIKASALIVAEVIKQSYAGDRR